MPKISVVDIPTPDNTFDRLGTQSYANALAQFIIECDTPLTIGIQGEWGSGKTSLLNMIQQGIFSAEIKTRGRGDSQTGRDVYKTIWINTWEHSILKSPEETLVSIMGELTDTIVECDGKWETAQKAKRLLGDLARGMVKVGASAAAGKTAADLADSLMAPSENSVAKLRSALDEAIQGIIDRTPIERFVVFIDDLDRLDPTNAVQVLELLKNIFSVSNCVFVLAIDYQVVVKGLKEKFGEMNEQNEWEFRAFFDKIIQLPFMMPIGAYDLKSYVDSLLVDTGYFTSKEVKLIPWIPIVIRNTLGQNPRSLKRMVNSLSLINVHRNIQGTKIPPKLKTASDIPIEISIRAIVLSLVCIQIAFPKIFELLTINPDFVSWDDEFVSAMTHGENEGDSALTEALERAKTINEEDFDEGWEEAVFKIVWINKWQRPKLVDISQTLSIIKDKIVRYEDNSEHFAEMMQWAMKQAIVTSIVSSDQRSITSDSEEEDAIARRNAMGFWNGLKSALKDSGSVFESAIRPNTTGSTTTRRLEGTDDCLIILSARASGFLKLISETGDVGENYRIFTFLQSHMNEIEDATQCKVRFRIKPDNVKQSMALVCLREDVPNRGNMMNAAPAEQKIYFAALADVAPKFESILAKLTEDYARVRSEQDAGVEIEEAAL
jgi:hypothetical protein